MEKPSQEIKNYPLTRPNYLSGYAQISLLQRKRNDLTLREIIDPCYYLTGVRFPSSFNSELADNTLVSKKLVAVSKQYDDQNPHCSNVLPCLEMLCDDLQKELLHGVNLPESIKSAIGAATVTGLTNESSDFSYHKIVTRAQGRSLIPAPISSQSFANAYQYPSLVLNFTKNYYISDKDGDVDQSLPTGIAWTPFGLATVSPLEVGFVPVSFIDDNGENSTGYYPIIDEYHYWVDPLQRTQVDLQSRRVYLGKFLDPSSKRVQQVSAVIYENLR